jgi:DNA-3-methyladenine glycosylase I
MAHSVQVDVVLGSDGVSRCGWAGDAGSGLAQYHDEVWGRPAVDENALFEALTLGVFQVGLSWQVVFNKREAFRLAFRGFEPQKVAKLSDADIDALVQDAAIIRNRGKIRATVDNAHAMLAASPPLPDLARRFAKAPGRAPRRLADLPVHTPEAEALAKELKAQGFRYVGPTSVYAFMQNVGMVNDHLQGCFRAVRPRPGTDVRS